jgi:DNA helicase-2/ATP-dependent DNA helicase PcrA
MGQAKAEPEQILESLTKPQRDAVTHGDGPLLVLAGPGSGKTRVITCRAAYLAATVTDPQHILAITFTNKAADEMRGRIAALGAGRGMTVCTFHSLCARLLRRYAERAGVSPNFSIFDQADRVAAVKEAIKRLELAEENFPANRLESRISRFKNAMIGPEAAAERADGFEARAIARIYAAYEKVLAEQDALDFDDLLLRVAALLGDDAELRDRLEAQYRYVLVDEYQDTNHAQYLIARGLALRRRNLCVTGDPDQSIYGWRGANLGNILDFEEDFPDAKIVRLEQNYRSTKRILAVADGLISRNKKRKAKSLWTENAEGTSVRVVECDDAAEEAEHIAGQIGELVAAGRAYNDIAIFYRINALSRMLEEALRQANVPYRIVRGVAFYNRKEIKDVLAYLRVLVNPNDETALLRIINTPTRGIGKTTVDRLVAQTRATGAPLSHWVRHPQDVPGLGAAAIASVGKFAKLLDMLAPVVHAGAREAIENVLTLSGYRAALQNEVGRADTSAMENVDELVTAAAEYDEAHPDGSMLEWLHQVSLVSDQDAYDPEAGAVTLMTLHAAKGLEFPVVFIAGCEDGTLPHQMYQDKANELEEERRLFFVGLTRAEEVLTLTHARYRDLRGLTQRMDASRFLRELPPEHVEEVSLGQALYNAGPDREAFNEYATWQPGQLVRHPSYGMGRLLWVQPHPGRTRAGIRFGAYGQKVLILEFCKLEKVEFQE